MAMGWIVGDRQAPVGAGEVLEGEQEMQQDGAPCRSRLGALCATYLVVFRFCAEVGSFRCWILMDNESHIISWHRELEVPCFGREILY